MGSYDLSVILITRDQNQTRNICCADLAAPGTPQLFPPKWSISSEQDLA